MSSRILLQTTRRRLLTRPLDARTKRNLLVLGAAGAATTTTAAVAVSQQPQPQPFSLSSLLSLPKLQLDGLSSPRSPEDSTTISSSDHAFSSSSETPVRGGSSKSGGGLDPDLMKQLSGGSVAGMLSGLLVSIFSRTLVLLMGLSVVAIQVAARYGINIVDQLRLRERLGNKSRILAALEKNPTFKLSFGAFFALSAFMRF